MTRNLQTTVKTTPKTVRYHNQTVKPKNKQKRFYKAAREYKIFLAYRNSFHTSNSRSLKNSGMNKKHSFRSTLQFCLGPKPL